METFFGNNTDINFKSEHMGMYIIRTRCQSSEQKHTWLTQLVSSITRHDLSCQSPFDTGSVDLVINTPTVQFPPQKYAVLGD